MKEKEEKNQKEKKRKEKRHALTPESGPKERRLCRGNELFVLTSVSFVWCGSVG